jgi:hypothetical protein
MTGHGTNLCVDIPRAEAIARLNDNLRTTGDGGTIVITRAVHDLEGFDPAKLSSALAAYNGFDPDNDPHGERDFGDLELFGADLLWKIDYYDLERRFGSDDPANSSITSRVLTVMLASDY